MDKRVDESWKEQVARERSQAKTQPHSARQPSAPAARPTAKHAPATPPTARSESPPPDLSAAQAQQFEQFLSTLTMEALIHLGDVPHPATRQPQPNYDQARYIIDLLSVLQAKTQGNLTPQEAQLLEDAIYQLRMRYVQVTGDIEAPNT